MAFTKFHFDLTKGRNFTRGDNSKKKINTRLLFFHEESIHKFLDDISFRNIIVAKFQGPKILKKGNNSKSII